MKEKIICPICGKEYLGNTLDDCPVCDWEFSGTEDIKKIDEYNSFNHTTIRQAKDNFLKGLNIWGEPIKRRKFTCFKRPNK